MTKNPNLPPGTPVFQEVSGLESEAQVIEYRAGNNPIFAPIKMPGLQKVGNVTMKKGIFVTDQNLWTWFSSIAMNGCPSRQRFCSGGRIALAIASIMSSRSLGLASSCIVRFSG